MIAPPKAERKKGLENSHGMLWFLLGRHRYRQMRIARKLARVREKLARRNRRRAIGFNILAMLMGIVQMIRAADRPPDDGSTPQMESAPHDQQLPRAITLSEARGRGFWTFGRRTRSG